MSTVLETTIGVHRRSMTLDERKQDIHQEVSEGKRVNHLFCHNGSWYFYDDEWVICRGPFNTLDDVQSVFSAYYQQKKEESY